MLNCSGSYLKKPAFRICISLLILFLLIIPKFAVTANEEPSPHSYYPLTEGYSWTYHWERKSDGLTGQLVVENYERRYLASHIVTPQKEKKVTKVLGTEQKQISFSFVAKNSEGFYEIATQKAGDPKIHFSPVPLLQFPIEVGNTWTSKETLKVRGGTWHTEKTITIPIQYEIVETDLTVTVSAGTFKNCIKLKGTGSKNFTYEGSGEKTGKARYKSTYWLAPGVGVIQKSNELSGEGVTEKAKVFYQLETFDKPKDPGLLPIADAGPDKEIDSEEVREEVTINLDGSKSEDPDGNITSYKWMRDGIQIASGEKPSVNLPAGAHEIVLEVEDNEGFRNSDTLTVAVQIDNLYFELLRFIPASANNKQNVYINNYKKASEQLEITRPGSKANYSDIVEYGKELEKGYLLDGGFISGANYLSSFKNSKERAGYDLRDLESSILAGLPPEKYNAIELNLQTERVRKNLLNYSDWPEPSEHKYQGIDILSWGEDFEMNLLERLNPPVYDQYGRGANLAFYEGSVFHTVWSDGVRQMVDATKGRVKSLADLKDYQLLAQELKNLDVYSALLTNRYISQETLEAEDKPGEVKLVPYKTYATSIGKDESGFYLGLVVIHANSQLAKENASLLTKRIQREHSLDKDLAWSEIFNIDQGNITVDEKVLTAKVPIRSDISPKVWVNWYSRRDNLLLAESLKDNA